MRQFLILIGCLVMPALLCTASEATNLYSPGTWSSLASDRIAHQAGDAITILVYESSTANNTASSSSRKGMSLSGSIAAGSFAKSASGSLSGSSDSAGSTNRSGQMVAEISATVESVFANGDLQVVGSQELHINGERTHIKVRGRVRLADIAATNTILSSRLADATIDYDGTGFVSRSAKPGVVTRIFSWLGLL